MGTLLQPTPGLLFGTRPGAEPTTARVFDGNASKKLATTRETVPNFGSHPFPVDLDEQLVVSNAACCPREVAGVARGRKVLTGVVQGVVVQVIDHESARCSSCARHPVHFDAAVVAGVRTRADTVVEQHPMLRDLPAGGRERMIAPLDVLVPVVHRVSEGGEYDRNPTI